MTGYDTNLAAEFHVLSVLHRLGLNATLTLGNKKSVDIVVVRDSGRRDFVTIDVKGLAGKTSWPVDNVRPKEDHFLVFVSFLGRIEDPGTAPEVYVIPYKELAGFVFHAPSGRKVVQLSRLRNDREKFQNAWHLLQASRTEAQSTSCTTFSSSTGE